MSENGLLGAPRASMKCNTCCVPCTLEAFELREGQWVLLKTLTDNDSVSLPPFDAISFSLGDLWSDS